MKIVEKMLSKRNKKIKYNISAFIHSMYEFASWKKW